MGLVTTGHCRQEANRLLSAVARGFHANRPNDMYCQGREGVFTVCRVRGYVLLYRDARAGSKDGSDGPGPG